MAFNKIIRFTLLKYSDTILNHLGSLSLSLSNVVNKWSKTVLRWKAKATLTTHKTQIQPSHVFINLYFYYFLLPGKRLMKDGDKLTG